MVTGLAKGATEQSVKQRFSDVSLLSPSFDSTLTDLMAGVQCGNIRDVVVTSLSDQDVATVEFESIVSAA